jgi:hypothetical protein
MADGVIVEQSTLVHYKFLIIIIIIIVCGFLFLSLVII